MDESSTSPWSMVTLKSSKGNGLSDLVQGGHVAPIFISYLSHMSLVSIQLVCSIVAYFATAQCLVVIIFDLGILGLFVASTLLGF